MADKPKLGFKKDIRLEWMNHSLYLTLQGLSENEIRKEMDEYLSSQVTESGKPFSKGAINLIKPLLAIWFKDKPISNGFRDALIQEASSCDSSKWLPLHWALMTVEYPLWYHVADQFGRLFSLQDVVKPSQIYSRIKEIYGDSETVARNTRYIIATMAHWKVIEKYNDKNGLYVRSNPINISEEMYSLLCESIILEKKAVESSILMHDKSMFAFEHNDISIGEINEYLTRRLVVTQQGLERCIVSHM